ncbi:ferredoxin [Jatrophihabitans fulvus]
MKIDIDRDACQAYGLCAISAPEVFDVDEDGYVVSLIDGDVPDSLAESAREGVHVCPAQALREVH